MKTTLNAEEIRVIAQTAAENDYHINAGVERTAEIKDWKGLRKYINVKCYTMAGRLVKTYDLGYIDNATGEYVATKYTDFDLSEMIEAEEARIAEETETVEAETSEAETKAAETETVLPALTGSEKQIAWAEELRRQFMIQIEGIVAKNPDSVSRERFENAVGKVIAAQTDARWWIDSRDDDLSRVSTCHIRRDALRAAGN